MLVDLLGVRRSGRGEVTDVAKVSNTIVAVKETDAQGNFLGFYVPACRVLRPLRKGKTIKALCPK